ncbi:MAG: hypothetical protein JSW51_05940 [Gemmatimonadota bacterium]|nr:MAG: hypothetical protein JSW51_05940 [Gemmatimonadota bacterium]
MKETQDPGQLLRFALAVITGAIVIYGLGQIIELGLVVYVNGSMPQDSMQYILIRNHSEVLVAKLFYTAALGVGAGYLAAWIGGRMGILAGVSVALAQVVGIVWAIFSGNPLQAHTPIWVWITLLIIAPPAVITGAWIRGRRYLRTD